MKILLKALFGDWLNCIIAAIAVFAAVAVTEIGEPHLASWLMPFMLLMGAGYLASRYGRS